MYDFTYYFRKIVEFIKRLFKVKQKAEQSKRIVEFTEDEYNYLGDIVLRMHTRGVYPDKAGMHFRIMQKLGYFKSMGWIDVLENEEKFGS